MLELFQKEGCPYSAKVRGTMTELDLDYICRNVKAGSRKETLLEKVGGKVQVPFLLDAERDVRLYESEAIIRYLRERFGS